MTPSEAAAGKELQPQSSCLPGENNVDTVQRPTESKRSRCAPDRELHTVQRSTRSRGLPDRQLHRVLRSTRSRGPHGPEVYTVQRSTRSGGLHGPEVHAVRRSTRSRGPRGPETHGVQRSTGSDGPQGPQCPEEDQRMVSRTGAQRAPEARRGQRQGRRGGWPRGAGGQRGGDTG